MGDFIETCLRRRMIAGGFRDAASSVFIRVVSNVDHEWSVPSPVRKHFRGNLRRDMPSTLSYQSKAIMMFQKIDDSDICLFCMYVQEYDASAPDPNKRQVYISYLDSVEYFRPREARTAVYHEILVSYLAWVRKRGFVKAHLWACPPQRGNNFIFWCHPQHQRTPSKDRLLAWYRSMLVVARENGVVTRVNNFFSEYFNPLVNGQGGCPPLFEGDYWIEEACRVYLHRQRKRVTVSDDASVYQMCEAFIRTLRLHPCAHAFNQPVDPEALRIPDYFLVIKRPMDLGTVASKLKEKRYKVVRHMLADIELVLDNAMEYNPPKHPVHVAASNLGAVFEREWASLEVKWQARQERTDECRSVAELANMPLRDDVELQDDPTTPPQRVRSASCNSLDSMSDGDADEVLLVGDALDDDEAAWAGSAPPPTTPTLVPSASDEAIIELLRSPLGKGGASSPTTSMLRQNWLLGDVSKAVLKLREDLLVLDLSADAYLTASERERGLEAWRRYTSDSVDLREDTNDPDPKTMQRPLIDGRHTLLEVSMFRNLQFDSLRRAKHSTAMILYHLHFPKNSLDAHCAMCSTLLSGIRWHCAQCTGVDICRECSTQLQLQCEEGHPLTPYQITSFES